MLRLSLGRKILLAGSATAVLAIASPSFGQIGGIGGGAGVGGAGVGPSVGPSGGAAPATPAVPNVNPGNIGPGGAGSVGGSGSGSVGNQGAAGAGSVSGQGRGTVGNAVQGSGNAAGQAQGNVGNRTGNAAGNVGGQGQGAIGNPTGNAAGNVTGQGQGSLGNRTGNAAGNVGGQGQGALGNRTGNAAGNTGGQVQGTVQGAQGGVGGAFDVTRRGALGVAVNPSNNTLSVSNVHNGSVAQRAGLRTGDQIVSINGQAVRTHQDLSTALRSAADLNNATTIAFNRNGRLQNVQVDLSGAAGGTVRGALDTAAGASASAGRPILGIGVESDAQGLRILRVNPGSVAEQLQLQPNDRVVSVNGRRVMSSAELATELNGVLEADGQVAIVISRNGQTRTVNHTFQRASEGVERAADRAGDRAQNALERGANRLDTNVNPNRQ